MYYYVSENPTELYYERHQLLVGQARSAHLARKARIKMAQPKRKSSRAIRGGLGLFAAALLMVGVVLLGASGPAHAATTFTVTNTTDANNTCDASGCSLREAITAANNTPNSGGPDLIRFEIPQGFADPQSGVMSIQPTSALPTITEQVTIDGYTQPGAFPNTLAKGTNAKLLIELDGSGAGQNSSGLRIEASNTVARGLVINRFDNSGVELCCESTSTNGVRIEGNFIGTDPSGTIALRNVGGVDNFSGVDGTIVGGPTTAARNLISGNDFVGIFIHPATKGTKVQGNLIGTKKDGIGKLGNDSAGVSIPLTGAPAPLASGILIGGSTAASANTIAFNGSDGVQIGSVSTANRILGNSIFSNKDLGIDLIGGSENGSDTTANDPGDKDVGANGLQNKPAVGSAVTASGKTTIKGKLSSKPNQSYVVRFFSNPSGTNEGKTSIGQKKVSTNTEGKVSFTFLPAQKVGVGKTITATATDSGGNTSEFSTPRAVVAA